MKNATCKEDKRGFISWNIPLEVMGTIVRAGLRERAHHAAVTGGKYRLRNVLLHFRTGTKFLSHIMQMNPLLNAMAVPVISLIKMKTV